MNKPQTPLAKMDPEDLQKLKSLRSSQGWAVLNKYLEAHIQSILTPQDPKDSQSASWALSRAYRDGMNGQYRFMNNFLDTAISKGEQLDKQEREAQGKEAEKASADDNRLTGE